jgi:VWFA-related protein
MNKHGSKLRCLSGFTIAAMIFVASVKLRAQEAPAPAQTPAGASTSAAPAPPAASAPQQPVIRRESKLVLVDAVVTDKKGDYVHDLTQKDFKVYEDNKEQAVTNFAFGKDPNAPPGQNRHYTVLFFDYSTMNVGDQAQARAAAVKFVEADTGPDRVMAVFEFGGNLALTQNFTEDPERLKKAVAGIKTSGLSDANAAANDPNSGASMPSGLG